MKKKKKKKKKKKIDERKMVSSKKGWNQRVVEGQKQQYLAKETKNEGHK